MLRTVIEWQPVAEGLPSASDTYFVLCGKAGQELEVTQAVWETHHDIDKPEWWEPEPGGRLEEPVAYWGAKVTLEEADA